MEFSLDARTARLSVGEFSAFTVGPHDVGAGVSAGLWRAQLGTHWHNELRAQATVSAPTTEFEVPITGSIVHRGWTLTLTGRIDQLLRPTPPLGHLLSDKGWRAAIGIIRIDGFNAAKFVTY